MKVLVSVKYFLLFCIVKLLKIARTMLIKRKLCTKLIKMDNNNNKKRSHTQLDSRKQVIAFQDRVITINIKEAQHPLK